MRLTESMSVRVESISSNFYSFSLLIILYFQSFTFSNLLSYRLHGRSSFTFCNLISYRLHGWSSFTFCTLIPPLWSVTFYFLYLLSCIYFSRIPPPWSVVFSLLCPYFQYFSCFHYFQYFVSLFRL